MQNPQNESVLDAPAPLSWQHNRSPIGPPARITQPRHSQPQDTTSFGSSWEILNSESANSGAVSGISSYFYLSAEGGSTIPPNSGLHSREWSQELAAVPRGNASNPSPLLAQCGTDGLTRDSTPSSLTKFVARTTDSSSSEPVSLNSNGSPVLAIEPSVSKNKKRKAETKLEPRKGKKKAKDSAEPDKTAQMPTSEEQVPHQQDNMASTERPVARARRRGKLNPEARAGAALVRRGLGQCLRCKLQKRTCDGNNPCKPCIESHDKARKLIYKEPCWRPNLKELSLVRHSNGRFGQDKVAFLKYRWRDLDIPAIGMDLRWSLPGKTRVNLPPLKVFAREYQPDPNDATTTYYWQVNGQEILLKTKAHACPDDDELLRDVQQFLDQSQVEVQRWVMEQQTDPLALLTYKEAIRYRDRTGSNLIDLALRMQCGAILSQGWGTVVNGEMTDQETNALREAGICDYDKYNRFQNRPVTQAMGHQLDVAILKNIMLDQEKLIKQLKDLLFGPVKEKPWYQIFLAYSVLLLNLEFIHHGARTYIISKLKTALEYQVSFVVRTQIEKWENSAELMLTCFTRVLRGDLPLKAIRKNMDELKRRNLLDDTAVEYLQRLDEILAVDNFPGKKNRKVPQALDASPEHGRWFYRLFNGESS
ncbi:hypothetical protein TWF481_008705 [Arthrobotrys musiformis]|uniref:Zn(2)-C6 fungal-type domain-containing protein n=1 Tax=Arthrobotrys musiformis TaxID=47236 RepID=A0AAV9W8W7_9PEZI